MQKFVFFFLEKRSTCFGSVSESFANRLKKLYNFVGNSNTACSGLNRSKDEGYQRKNMNKTGIPEENRK